MARLRMVLAVMMAGTALAGCAAAIGGVAAIGADAIVEEERGGDGLF